MSKSRNENTNTPANPRNSLGKIGVLYYEDPELNERTTTSSKGKNVSKNGALKELEYLIINDPDLIRRAEQSRNKSNIELDPSIISNIEESRNLNARIKAHLQSISITALAQGTEFKCEYLFTSSHPDTKYNGVIIRCVKYFGITLPFDPQYDDPNDAVYISIATFKTYRRNLIQSITGTPFSPAWTATLITDKPIDLHTIVPLKLNPVSEKTNSQNANTVPNVSNNNLAITDCSIPKHANREFVVTILDHPNKFTKKSITENEIDVTNAINEMMKNPAQDNHIVKEHYPNRVESVNFTQSEEEEQAALIWATFFNNGQTAETDQSHIESANVMDRPSLDQ